MAEAAAPTEITGADGWLSDQRNNRASIEYFGSRDAAEAALRSLKNCDWCTNCSDCSDCSRCSGCSGCSDCSRCSGCSRCSDCSDCSGCSDCSDCSGCSDCSDCSDCSGCSDCSDCSDCSRCSRCSRCSDCSGCSGCSDCSDCSNIAWLRNREGLQAVPRTDGKPLGAPPVPVIPEIHKVIFDAVSQPKALNMASWHTCETTHCRAGWAVHLAGKAGRDLEAFYNTELAAMLIYAASDPGFTINPARFHDSNEAAMDDMRKLAEREADPA